MTEPPIDQSSRKMARAYLFLSPFGAALAYGLAALQGADTRTCLISTAAALALCLGWSLLYFLRGARAMDEMGWINVILKLLSRR